MNKDGCLAEELLKDAKVDFITILTTTYHIPSLHVNGEAFSRKGFNEIARYCRYYKEQQKLKG